MKQDPACTWSLWSLTAASSPAPGEEQGEARDLELLGFVPLRSSAGAPRQPEPLRMVWQSCQLIFFHALLERRRKDECHQGGDPGGDSGQVTQTGCSHPGCPLSSFPTRGDGFCHPPRVL